MGRKGRETEKEAVELYERAGYETYLPPDAKYREQDVFGWFDILAFGHGVLIGSQVKTNRARGIGEYFDQTAVYDEHDAIKPEYLVKYEGEGWKLYRPGEGSNGLRTGNYCVGFDGRETGNTPDLQLIEVLANAGVVDSGGEARV